MLSRLPAVSGEFITRDWRGCARPAPGSPRCQAGTASETRRFLTIWSAGGDRDLELPLKHTESFDKGESAERQKWNFFFFLPCGFHGKSPQTFLPLRVLPLRVMFHRYKRERTAAKEHSRVEAQCPARR